MITIWQDLLLSTPLSAAPLSSLTSPSEPPPHVAPIGTQTLPAWGRMNLPGGTGVGWGKEDGGEWEREGFGKGLEERLEEVLAAEAKAMLPPKSTTESVGPADKRS